MKKGMVTYCMLGLLLLGGTLAFAHPHLFNKKVIVNLPGDVEVTITYNTAPANETRAAKMAVGEFASPAWARIRFSADLKVGNATIAAGEYVIGVIKNSEEDWTMALYPGQLGRGAKPEMSKLIKLDSMYSRATMKAEHMLVDILPGTGKLEGKTVLTLHFGSMFLVGALA